MKKEILYYFILICIIAGMMLIETNIIPNKSLQISKVIDVAHFEKLDIELDCNIYVSLGDEQKVVLEGPEQSLNLIEARLDKGILTLRSKGQGMLSGFLGKNRESGDVNIYLQLTASDQLISPKKGKLITNETLILNELECQRQFSLNKILFEVLPLPGQQLTCAVQSNLL